MTSLKKTKFPPIINIPKNPTPKKNISDAIKKSCIANSRILYLVNPKINRMDMTIQNIGSFIATERRNQNMTLNELASTSGVAFSTLHKLEKGVREVSVSKIEAALNALGYTLVIRQIGG